MMGGLGQAECENDEVTLLKENVEAVPSIGSEHLINSRRDLPLSAAIRDHAHAEGLRPRCEFRAGVTKPDDSDGTAEKAPQILLSGDAPTMCALRIMEGGGAVCEVQSEEQCMLGEYGGRSPGRSVGVAGVSRVFRLYEKKRGNRRTGSKTVGNVGEALFFGIFFAVGCAAFAYMSVALVWPEWRANRQFVPAKCLVLDKRMGSRPATEAEPARFRPEFRVRYEVEGQQHVVDDVFDVTNLYSPDEQQAQAALAGFEIGREYPCWYDPLDPRREAPFRRPIRSGPHCLPELVRRRLRRSHRPIRPTTRLRSSPTSARRSFRRAKCFQ